MENITIRKKLRRSISESNISRVMCNNESIHNSTLLNTSTVSVQSVPQNIETSFSLDLKIELDNTKLKLQSADSEIENLAHEITQLTQTIHDQKKQIELLKKMTRESISSSISSTTTPVCKKILKINVNAPRISPIHHHKSVCLSLGNTPITKKNIEQRQPARTPSTNNKSQDIPIDDATGTTQEKYPQKNQKRQKINVTIS